MNRRNSFIILIVLFLGFGLSIYQYSETFKTEIVSATSTVPNPGHTWASMECNSNGLCVDTTNNRLGIGIATPTGKIDIRNDGDSYYLLAAGVGTNKDSYLRAGSASSGVVNIGDANTLKTTIQGNGGNVGIGTTTPGAKLDVEATSGSIATILRTTDSAANANYQLGNNSSANRGGVAVFGSTFAESNGYHREGTYLYNNGTGGVAIYSEAASPIIFGTSNSERARIDSGGNVGIGTTSPSYTLTVAGTAWVTSGSWSGSDIRWKKNINTLSQSSSLEKVMALNPVNYQWKTDEYPEMKFSNGTQLGFIAQDVEKIIPEVVTTNNEGYKGISYEKIVPVLTSAIQEQQAQIRNLTSENKELKLQVNDLKSLVCSDHPLASTCK